MGKGNGSADVVILDDCSRLKTTGSLSVGTGLTLLCYENSSRKITNEQQNTMYPEYMNASTILSSIQARPHDHRWTQIVRPAIPQLLCKTSAGCSPLRI
jgi:hypothetical protein